MSEKEKQPTYDQLLKRNQYLELYVDFYKNLSQKQDDLISKLLTIQ